MAMSRPGSPYGGDGDNDTICAINANFNVDSMVTLVMHRRPMALLATMVPADYQCRQWLFDGDKNGTNGVICDSVANGSQMMLLVPMITMAAMMPMATMVIILTLTLTIATIGAKEPIVAIESPLSPMVPLPFDGDPGRDIAI